MLKLYASLKVHELLKEYKFKLTLGINDVYSQDLFGDRVQFNRNRITVLTTMGQCVYERTFYEFYREHAEALRQGKNSVFDRLHSKISVSDIT